MTIEADKKKSVGKAKSNGKLTVDFYEHAKEYEFLRKEREQLSATRSSSRVGKDWNGVALSGGGIRSATFCLGAMQALAEKGLLEHFDYISSVSGGGYTASALQWWWHQPEISETGSRFDASKERFPYGTELSIRPKNETIHSRVLDFLRQHGKYLTPGDGLTIWSAASVVWRTLFLNLTVWLPLAAFIFILLVGVDQGSIAAFPDEVKKIPNLLAWLVNDDWTGSQVRCGTQECRLPFGVAFGVSILLFAAICAFFSAFSIILAFLSFASRPDWVDYGKSLRNWTVAAILSFAVICLAAIYKLLPSHNFWTSWDPFTIALAAASLAGAVVSIFIVIFSRVDSNYFWRRRFETLSGTWLIFATLVITVGSVPLLPYYLLNYGGAVRSALAAAVGAVGGLASAAYGHSIQSKRQNSEGSGSILATIGSAVFIYFILICAYLIAQLYWNTHDILLVSAVADRWIQGGVLFSIGLACSLALLTNINHVGLHRYYRDRIMEAFMPSLATIRDPDHHIVPSPAADNLQISDLWPDISTSEKRRTPYPLINTNVVLVNDEKPKYALRGGDSFVVSPLFVGSAATGWQDTKSYIGYNGALTLASAMASSGAALNANAAYVGSGTTRDRLLSIVMMLLNLRLGLWAASPSAKAGRYSLFTPDHFHPGLTFGLLRKGYKRTSDFVELTDGGHFDNIGLYELIRRRCGLIVAIDAEADPTTSMPALVSVVQRIEEDFGTTINLDPAIVATIVPQPGTGFPIDAKYVKSPFFCTDINYGPIPSSAEHPPEPSLLRTTGKLIYVKAALIEELDFTAKGYWALNPTFPHQSTVDQFFDPTQFEAYRQLGYRSMMKAIDGVASLANLNNKGASETQLDPDHK